VTFIQTSLLPAWTHKVRFWPFPGVAVYSTDGALWTEKRKIKVVRSDPEWPAVFEREDASVQSLVDPAVPGSIRLVSNQYEG